MRPQRPTFLLREAPDIDRVAVHVLTHWKLPSVDVRIDRLPLLDSQRMQDHFARTAAACNCVVGEALGGVTLLVGSCLACVWQSWRFLFLALAATVAVALAGKCAEVAWSRLKLFLGLRRLRLRLADAIAGRLLGASPAVIQESKTYDYPLNSRNGDAVALPGAVRTDVPRSAGRLKLDVRNAGDIETALRHLFAHWALPRIVLEIEGIPAQDLERAQDRLVRLSGGYSHQLAGVLAFATFVIGMTLIMRPPREVMSWTMDPDWSDFLVVIVATFLAMVLGHLGEVASVRVRLRRVLLELRRLLSQSG